MIFLDQRPVLQEFLSYHPGNGSIFDIVDSEKDATVEVEALDYQLQAQIQARDLELEITETLCRVLLGQNVDKMTSAEMKRDIRLFAKNNPATFISLAKDDNVQLRNFAIKAQEAGIIILSQDQRTFTWGSNNRKLMNVPFDENPYSAFAAFLKTDEGVEIYKSIDKKL